MQQMKNTDLSNDEIRERIKKGLDLTFKKLLEEKRKNNGVFVFSENGVIKQVRAVDIKD